MFIDFEFGWLRAVIAEPNRNHKKRFKAFVPEDFMALSDNAAPAKKPKVMSWEEQLDYVKTVLHPAFSKR